MRDVEAASPGEIKNGGAGIKLSYGFADTPFGEALIADTTRGICHLSFVTDQGRTGARDVLVDQWPKAERHRDDKRATEFAGKIFMRRFENKSQSGVRAFVRGTPFQVQVWRALLRVPPSSLTTYGRLSAAIDQPNAARAVGSAVGANPIGFIIPCHRVIRETGALGNYRWDRIRKRAMIGWEMSAHFVPSQSDSTGLHASAA